MTDFHDDTEPLDEARRRQRIRGRHGAASEDPRMNDAEEAVVRLVQEDAAKPIIRVKAGELAEIATLAESAIIKAGLPLYRRGATLVRPVVEEVDAAHGRKTKVAVLHPLGATHLRDLLAQVACWEKYDRRMRAWAVTNPPTDAAATILARYGEWAFPPIAGILSTPTLRPDGTMLCEPGYDPATRLYLADPPELPAIPPHPSKDDARAALAFLESLLEEFPFVDDPSRAVALSALITPVCRGAFSVAPMHVARSPVPGSGKSYLFDVVGAVNIGQPCPVMAAGRTEEETEKRLGAALLAGQPLMSIDNVNGELGGDALCQAIERPVVEIRILGRSELVRIEARGTTFFATGNNLVLVGDMTRRAIVCTLDPVLERPELREFSGNPFADVLTDRGRYIAACLTICRAYIVAGRPDPAPRLASFEGWSDTVRSAVIWLGCADPVETMEAARAEDPELAALTELLATWRDTFGTGWSNGRTLAAVIKATNAREIHQAGAGDAYDGFEHEYRHPELREALTAVATVRGRINVRVLGNFMRRAKGRIAGGLCFYNKADLHGHAAHWWVEAV